MKMRMKINVTLPARIAVEDYHEFQSVQEVLTALKSGLKVVEVGYNGAYTGIIFKGKLTDKANKKLVNKIKEEADQFEKDNY